MAGGPLQNRKAYSLGNRFPPDSSRQEGKPTDEKKAGHKEKIPARTHRIIKEEGSLGQSGSFEEPDDGHEQKENDGKIHRFRPAHPALFRLRRREGKDGGLFEFKAFNAIPLGEDKLLVFLGGLEAGNKANGVELGAQFRRGDR